MTLVVSPAISTKMILSMDYMISKDDLTQESLKELDSLITYSTHFTIQYILSLLKVFVYSDVSKKSLSEISRGVD